MGVIKGDTRSLEYSSYSCIDPLGDADANAHNYCHDTCRHSLVLNLMLIMIRMVIAPSILYGV